MRRLLTAVTLAAVCATAVACTSDSGDPAGSGPTSAAPSTAAAGNTEQVCAAAEKVLADSSGRFSQEMTRIMKAATAGDKSATADAVTTIRQLFTSWADGLRKQAAKATDAGLEAALNDAANQIEKVSGSIRSMNDLNKADAPFNAANEKMEQYCG